ncbi:MAG TPA: RDD family protein [Cellvibrio sp.]|nr:RDD family protein [Cellvibrio sp.]
MNDSQEPNDFQPKPSAPMDSTARDNTAAYHKRFLAFAIDVFLLLFGMMFMMRYLGLEPANTADMQAAYLELSAKINALTDGNKMLLVFAPQLIFFVLHGASLYQRGQTIGKRIMGIAIVTLGNQKPAFLPLIAQRYMSQWLMGMVPVVGPLLRLVDIVLIFRTDKRCLHDLIAKTKVIDLKIPVAASPDSFVA